MSLNLDSLLTLNEENRTAVTHVEKEYEYAQIFDSSVEEGVKSVTPWSAYYYTYPDSFYFVKPSAAGQLVCGKVPKPVGMRFWAKRFG